MEKLLALLCHILMLCSLRLTDILRIVNKEQAIELEQWKSFTNIYNLKKPLEWKTKVSPFEHYQMNKSTNIGERFPVNGTSVVTKWVPLNRLMPLLWKKEFY